MAYPLDCSISASVAECFETEARMLVKPVSWKLEIVRMPTAWWLRPVNSEARVGEHSGVTWKLEYRSPWAANLSMFGVSIVDP